MVAVDMAGAGVFMVEVEASMVDTLAVVIEVGTLGYSAADILAVHTVVLL